MIRRKSGVCHIKTWEGKPAGAMSDWDDKAHLTSTLIWKEGGDDTQVGRSAISHGHQHRRETSVKSLPLAALSVWWNKLTTLGSTLQHLAQKLPSTSGVWYVCVLRAASLLTFESLQLNETGQRFGGFCCEAEVFWEVRSILLEEAQKSFMSRGSPGMQHRSSC